jgi:hypothetical protein
VLGRLSASPSEPSDSRCLRSRASLLDSGPFLGFGLRLDDSIPCSPADPVTRTHRNMMSHVSAVSIARTDVLPSESIPTMPLQRPKTFENPHAIPFGRRATLLEFFASIARVMTVDEVTLRFVPGHLQGLITLLASRLFPRPYSSPFGHESASEISPSEVSPSVDRSSSPRPGPLAVRRRPSRTTEVVRS